MSYLCPLRLHFIGRFRANIPTVNNLIAHYDPAHPLPPEENGFNPSGDSTWRLIGCRVTTAHHADGREAATDDAVRSLLVADSDRRVAAKLVDLDPQQQLVSTIYGLEVRLCTAAGDTLLRGQFAPGGFSDLWVRTPSWTGKPDGRLGASYQSVLSDLVWGKTDTSPWLRQFRSACGDGLVSIKFNVDGYIGETATPEVCHGRIVGTLGPAYADEPRHFVLGRHFRAVSGSDRRPVDPVGGINHAVARLDTNRGKLLLDLGNALPASSLGGSLQNLGQLSVVCLAPSLAPRNDPAPAELAIGKVEYTSPGWYDRTAGIVELPYNRPLNPEEIARIEANPLALRLAAAADSNHAHTLPETPGGVYLRNDTLSVRLAPDESVSVKLYATRFGRPLAADVVAFFDAGWLQTPSGNQPKQALRFPARLTTDARGTALAKIRAKSPRHPRPHIDGQVFGVRFAIEETLSPAWRYPFSRADILSVLVWDRFKPEKPQTTWHGTICQIFTQYRRLYPIMDRFMRLDDFEAVCAHRDLLLLVFTLDPQDPNYMPVTRDLSPAKRAAIVRWLQQLDPATGCPALGRPRRSVRPKLPLEVKFLHAEHFAAVEPLAGPFVTNEGKTSALARIP